MDMKLENQNRNGELPAKPATRRKFSEIVLAVIGVVGVTGALALGSAIYQAGTDAGVRASSVTIDSLRHQLLEVTAKLKDAESDVHGLKEKLADKEEQLKSNQSNERGLAQSREKDLEFLKARLANVDAALSSGMSMRSWDSSNREDDDSHSSKVADLRAQRNTLLEQISKCQ